MNQYKTYIVLFWGLIICSANYCSCGNNKVGPTYYFSQQFKDYTLFKEGSKWIYQLENSNQKDTVLLIYRDVKIDKPNGDSRNYEFYLLRLSSSYFNDIIISSGYVGGFLAAEDNCSFIYESNLLPIPIYFESKELGSPKNNLLGLDYVEFHINYQIGDKVYNEVKVFEVLGNNITDTRLPKKVYYAKNIGLIRKELWNGQVWNLVDYEVSQ